MALIQQSLYMTSKNRAIPSSKQGQIPSKVPGLTAGLFRQATLTIIYRQTVMCYSAFGQGNIKNQLELIKLIMKKLVTISILLSVYSVSECQLKNNLSIKDLTKEIIPKNIIVSGKLIEAKQWEDLEGENILIISRFRPKTKPLPDNPGQSTESTFLFINHYVKKGPSYNLVWSYRDSVMDCLFDLWIGPIDNSTTITDLNSDNNTEITIVYSYTCRSDVSPSKMKVILHNKGNTYCLKGTMYSTYIIGELDKKTFEYNLMKIERSKNENLTEKLKIQMGRYENEDDFASAPKVFLEYCRNEWKQFMDKDQFRQLRGTDY